MNLIPLGSGGAAQRVDPLRRAAPGDQARPATRAEGPLPQRTAMASGPAGPRASPSREILLPSAEVPMAGSLARAHAEARTALTQVEVLFEKAAHGEPLPLALAEATVSGLLASLEGDEACLPSIVRLKAHRDYACMHSVAVCVLMACLAREMRLDEKQRREAALAGLLHDIGKAFLPAHVFAKPGRLTEDEFAVVRRHPELGFDALEATAGLSTGVRSVARHHHERPDGRGYPDRLDGPRISLLARMGAVCDVYDAVTSNRPYKDGWDPVAAMRAMATWTQDGQFDACVMQAFKRLMGDHPIGSLVRLRSERLGVVNASAGGASRRGQPSPLSVTAFYCLRTGQPMPPEIVEIRPGASAEAIVSAESNATWRFRRLDELWAGDVAAGLHPVHTPFGGLPLKSPRPASQLLA
ncbi:MAG TPA: HD-GYP domain-containing protein [Methylibium sp.]|uniref:HD-GYP domain-containing protein n=1 Tax=Methylibium sp. TaxID=2067992 RepID=UPI002DBB4F40|nr:HD-GYP domain-containing protein [Methylibium sp.]HEU4460066.1 HD-GYP domain-containing protein [Methylibium sp.]